MWANCVWLSDNNDQAKGKESRKKSIAVEKNEPFI